MEDFLTVSLLGRKGTLMDPATTAQPHGSAGGEEPNMTLSRLRHDIRNYLNAIKLSCALLRRRTQDGLSIESVEEIDRSADKINDLVGRFMGDAEAPRLLKKD